MTDDRTPNRPRVRGAIIRVVAATAAALAFALGVYLLLEATQSGGLMMVSFLLVLPAALSAFVAYVADPWKERSHGFYAAVPLWMLGVTIVAGIVILREGAVCVVMLAPLWLVAGLAGAEFAYRIRRRAADGRTYSLAVLAIPLIAMQVEPLLPVPDRYETVVRTVDIAARPERIWPLLRGIPDVRPDEGQWNVTQDVVGIPRPVGARLIGEGVGAERHAVWGADIRFRERIDEWQVHRSIGWRFHFDDADDWVYTDRHLIPNSPHFAVTQGGYRMQPLETGETRVTLWTRYRMRTHLNTYAMVWGEIFLGDLENNLLTIVKHRAERR